MTTARIADRRRCLNGESPRWDPDQDRVVWVDILGGSVLWRPVGGGDGTGHGSFTPGGRIGGMERRAGGRGYVLAQDRAIRCFDADGRPEGFLVDAVPGEGTAMRVNECAVDPAGRLLFGTMAADQAEGAGALWRRDPDGTLQSLVAPATVSNGMGWTPDGTAMYWVDSPTLEVRRLPYDDRGVGAPEVLATIEEGVGVPDGLSVDADGGVWVAIHGGGQVRHYDPSGTETHRVEVPAAQTSSCVLVAGPDGPLLFITSGASGMSETDLVEQPAAGMLFVADVDTPPAEPPTFPG